MFAQISPNLPEKFLCKYFRTWRPFLGMTSKIRKCVSTNIGCRFFKITQRWAPFCAIFQGVAHIFRDFANIFTDFAQRFTDFARIFDKSKLLRVRLHTLNSGLLDHWHEQCKWFYLWSAQAVNWFASKAQRKSKSTGRGRKRLTTFLYSGL